VAVGDKAAIVNQHVWAGLLLTYLVLPPVANKQFQVLDCIPFPHDGGRYLRSDTSIDCNSSAYASFQALISVLIVLYQTIPLVWLVLLVQHRVALNPKTSNGDQALALFLRDRNPSLNPIRFLFNDCE
jgi:hypothetical protein